MPKQEVNTITNVFNKSLVNQFKLLVQQIQHKIDNDSTLSNKEKTAERFRLRNLKNGLKIIQLFPDKITSGNDLKHIQGIGSGIMKRIDEVLETKELSELPDTKELKKISKKIELIQELSQVINIGSSKAKELVDKYNVKSVDDLKKRSKSGEIPLNDKILIGLKYYGKVQDHILRKEIDSFYKILKKIVNNIDEDMILKIAGSYRRKKPFSNDIDILLSHYDIVTPSDNKKSEVDYLNTFIDTLKKKNIIVDDLTDGVIKTKYMGFSKYGNNPVRRIDIRFVPYQSYYTALLYFTGSYEFNRDMRLVAKTLGYKLNEYGLYKLETKKGKETARMIKIDSEEAVFKKLGMKFLKPEER